MNSAKSERQGTTFWFIHRSIALAALMLVSCAACAYAGPSEPNTLTETNSLHDFLANSDNTGMALSEALHRMMAAVLIVVILGIAAIYASKKILPRYSRIHGKKIKLVETLPMGSRKAVHLLEVEGRQILIASTHDRITKLADLNDGFSFDTFSAEHIDTSEGE